MKENKTLDSMIETETEKLKKLEGKQNELDKKIRDCKANIEKYTLMKNSQQLNKLSNALNEKGINFDDILAAVAAGDLLALQDKINNAENDTEKEDVDTGEGNEE